MNQVENTLRLQHRTSSKDKKQSGKKVEEAGAGDWWIICVVECDMCNWRVRKEEEFECEKNVEEGRGRQLVDWMLGRYLGGSR